MAEAKKRLLTYAGLKALEDELENLKVVKRKEVAGKIKEAREQGHLSSVNEVSGKGFPDVTAGLADLLKEKEFRTRLTSEFRHFIAEWKRDESLLRFRYHRPEQLMERLKDLELPRREYVSDICFMNEKYSA